MVKIIVAFRISNGLTATLVLQAKSALMEVHEPMRTSELAKPRVLPSQRCPGVLCMSVTLCPTLLVNDAKQKFQIL